MSTRQHFHPEGHVVLAPLQQDQPLIWALKLKESVSGPPQLAVLVSLELIAHPDLG